MYHLKEYRNKKKLTQQQVANIIGINRSSYANYENNRREMDNDTLLKLADLFETSVDNLLGRTIEEPTVEDDGLQALVIERVQSLSDPALGRVMDFLDGLAAGQEIQAASAAVSDPTPEPAE